MRRLFAVFSNSSSEDSTDKKIREKKTRTKKDAEEGPGKQPEVKVQSRQTTQCEEKNGKSKNKPQVINSLREEDKDHKVKKKKSNDRDSGLGEMIDSDNSHLSDLTRRRRMQASQYGYFDQELEDERSHRHHSVPAYDDDDDDDDDLPLGLQKNRPASSLGYYQRSNISQEERSRPSSSYGYPNMFPNGDLPPGSTRPPKSRAVHLPEPLNVSVTSSSRPPSSPVATTPPLVFNNRQASKESRQYLRERKFSSSNSSESSASCDGGIRTRNSLYRVSQHSSPLTPGKSQCYNGGFDHYEENYNDHYHLNTPVNPTGRMRNLSLNSAVPRSDSFTRSVISPRRASDGAILSGANTTSEKDKKSMKMAEYHKYQEENIAAQYHRYRVNPLPVAEEEIIPARSMTPTLMQIQQEYKSVNAQNLRRLVDANDGASSPGRPKRAGHIENPRRISMTESNSGRTRSVQSPVVGKSSSGKPEHRKNHSETTIMQQQLNVPRAPQPRRNVSSAVHLSSQYHDLSGGSPTPNANGRSSGVFGNSIVTGVRPSTPPSMGVGYTKDRRKKSALSIVT